MSEETHNTSAERKFSVVQDAVETTIVAPKNHGPSPRFSTLVHNLFEPLVNLSAVVAALRKKPTEAKAHIATQFIKGWVQEVGKDIYPAFRLILPDKDRERAVYGLKEKALGRLWIKVLNLAKDSPDAKALSEWKQGGNESAGNFSKRCYEVLCKRTSLTEYGTMTVDEVNERLDILADGETDQAKQIEILTYFYKHMNATELKWLGNIILREMKMNATEKVFFEPWHPDAESLFNVTASLKRVCWELTDPNKRLSSDEAQVSLFACFMPQIAAFPKYSGQDIAGKHFKGRTFYIEEKIDGERMQMHMSDSGNKFRWWSRRSKDFTETYGNSLDDTSGSLTKRLRGVINPNIKNCVLDGEMVAYDPATKKIIPFGTLRTANRNEQNDMNLTKPMFMVFDILLLNDKPLVDFTLATRKKALNTIFAKTDNETVGQEGVLEVLPYFEASTADEIDTCLRKIIAESSEGLVIKDPNSVYKVNTRDDTWLKIKPEYMSEFGEKLDVVLIGGYYGSGKRGSILSSYLCGLRADGTDQFWSFFKVGGGLSASDYQAIRNKTEGKWKRWDNNNKPKNVLLAGPNGDSERPDVWIEPSESVVVEIKAASVVASDQYKVGLCLRFPRFRALRLDKTWEDGLTISQFAELRQTAEMEAENKELELEDRKRKNQGPGRGAKRMKLVNVSSDEDELSTEERPTSVFKNTTFAVLSDMSSPRYMSKVAVENLIKKHGGAVIQTADGPYTIPVGDTITIKVRALTKRLPGVDVIRPNWLLDCINEEKLVALEPRNLLEANAETLALAKTNVDEFGDSYTRPLTHKEMTEVLRYMNDFDLDRKDVPDLMTEVVESIEGNPPKGLLFYGKKIYLNTSNMDNVDLKTQFRAQDAYTCLEFGGADMVTETKDLVVAVAKTEEEAKELRKISSEQPFPFRVVSMNWVEESWKRGTLEIEDDYPL
ncbi:DNA ligase 4 [Yarrowia sp. C11]|nr:DNA ligase 4 [Yarrowia sp. E02]KAG5367508.1 DNA ligase 4 [Yarrowia sp. C11]